MLPQCRLDAAEAYMVEREGEEHTVDGSLSSNLVLPGLPELTRKMRCS
jgi:hypothetical protein